MFRTKTDIPRIFLEHECISAGKRHVYDAVYMIHDVISTANPFPDTAKFMFVGVRNMPGEPLSTPRRGLM